MGSRDVSQIERVVQEMDRLIAELSALRSQLAHLSQASASRPRSVRDAEYFGMWADRQDMQGLSSREWLEKLRSQQWTRS